MANADHTTNTIINDGKLPKGVLLRKRASGNYYYYQTRSKYGSRRKEYPLGTNKESALLAASFLSYDLYRKPIFNLHEFVNNELLTRVKKGAKKRNIPFDISVDEIKNILDKSGGKCSLTGITFDLVKDDRYRIRLWAPSIDRIDSSKGYTADNIRLVVASVNIALNDFGEEVLERIVKGIAQVKYGKYI